MCQGQFWGNVWDFVLDPNKLLGGKMKKSPGKKNTNWKKKLKKAYFVKLEKQWGDTQKSVCVPPWTTQETTGV